MELSLKLRVDEVGVLPQVGTVAELREAPSSCFMELLPHRQGPVSALFPGSSSHHGGEVPAPPWWSDDAVDIRALHLFKIRDAFVYPAWGVVVTRAGEVMRLTMEEAAYASPDLSALPHVERTGTGLSLRLPEALERRARVAVTMPSGGLANYGHFVLDCLPGAAAIARTGAFDDADFVMPALKPWQSRHLDLMGVQPFVTEAGLLAADEAIYTSALHHFLHTPNLTYRAVRDAQLARLGTRPAGDGGRRLYLSRGRDNTRVLASEQRLRRRLARAGFTIVEPGTLDVDGQIALFSGAEVVIGSAGAALANVLYCRPGTLVIEIQPQGMENMWVQRLCFIAGLASATWFCAARAVDPRHPERGLGYDIDVGRFMDFVAARMSDGRPAAEAAPARGLRAWFRRRSPSGRH